MTRHFGQLTLLGPKVLLTMYQELQYLYKYHLHLWTHLMVQTLKWSNAGGDLRCTLRLSNATHTNAQVTSRTDLGAGRAPRDELVTIHIHKEKDQSGTRCPP